MAKQKGIETVSFSTGKKEMTTLNHIVCFALSILAWLAVLPIVGTTFYTIGQAYHLQSLIEIVLSLFAIIVSVLWTRGALYLSGDRLFVGILCIVVSIIAAISAMPSARFASHQYSHWNRASVAELYVKDLIELLNEHHHETKNTKRFMTQIEVNGDGQHIADEIFSQLQNHFGEHQPLESLSEAKFEPGVGMPASSQDTIVLSIEIISLLRGQRYEIATVIFLSNGSAGEIQSGYISTSGGNWKPIGRDSLWLNQKEARELFIKTLGDLLINGEFLIE